MINTLQGCRVSYNGRLEKAESRKRFIIFFDLFHPRDRFSLKEIVNVEAKDDPKKGTRFLLELVRLCEKTKHSSHDNTYIHIHT